MTDKLKFVVEWEINNAARAFAAGDAESSGLNNGGFKWIAGVRPNKAGRNKYTEFTLTCDNERGGEWRCEADVDFVIHRGRRGSVHHKSSHRMEAVNKKTVLSFGTGLVWEFLVSPSLPYLTNGKIIVYFHVTIISSECNDPIDSTPILDLSKLISPNEMSNVTLVLEDKKLRVSKEFLAIHSPVFSAMFFGNFAENQQEEVELKDVVYEEFVDLLNLLYLGTVEITDRTVMHLLKLADQFQMERVVNLSKKHLTESNGFDLADKLIISDQFRLVSLRDHCLQSFTTPQELLQKLKSEYAHFSAETKVAIGDRLFLL
ncbi:hypothetical protein PENTCL1PPCAC_18893 [Pristionchus entomophagus]|uniref:BTB domain-containing protein n=1 Tax=Pristionchus entomophagus TaxID=358040 RepID=A0AAV5TQH9_9BILA|nr:hypothetical protein PENTCL1PPCAC_18893 [Pristionchus entomophagus]